MLHAPLSATKPLFGHVASLAPQLCHQVASAAPALSLAAWHAWRSASTTAGSPDPFTQQLQQKTEQEVLELLQKGRAGVSGGEQEQQGAASDEEESHVYNKETGEWGGPKGPEPTRYGDWDVKGRASDF